MADKYVLAELPLAPFVIINLTRLTVGVCMKVRFKSKVTRGFSFSPLRDSLLWIKIKNNLWDQGKRVLDEALLGVIGIRIFEKNNYRDAEGKILQIRDIAKRYICVIDQACSVKMAGYWPSSFFAFLWTETKSRSIKTQKRTRPISSHLDRTSLVNKGFIIWPKGYTTDVSPSTRR